MKKIEIEKWQVLPMKLMSHFNDCHEWCLMDRLWFKSNHNDNVNLNYIIKTTPIKSPSTLIRLLNRCVSKGWIDKKPYGLQGHHKYIFNKASFIIWIMSLSNDSAMSLSNDSAALSNDSAMSLSNDSAALSNDSAGTIKRYCIDNLDKLKDNKEIDNQKTNVDMTIYNNNPKHHNYPNLFEFKNKTISTQKQIVNQGIEGIGFETPNEFISLCQYVVDHPMFNGNEITTALKYVKPTPIIIEIPVHEVIEESIESDKKQLKAFFN